MRVTLPFIFGPYDYPEILCFSAFSFGQSGKFDFALGYSLSIIDALITKCKEKSFFIFACPSFLFMIFLWNGISIGSLSSVPAYKAKDYQSP